MIQLIHHKEQTSYWLRVFALYALAEACIQLLLFVIVNNFRSKPISLIEFHLLMWIFQCLLIWPIWAVAWSVRNKKIIVQILVNLGFYIMYSYVWFGPVQEMIGFLYDNLQQVTRTESNRLKATLDNGTQDTYLNYQLLKHAFRLSWFYLAAYFFNYKQEEKKRIELATANRELQLKMLKWHLNPSFYFKTIGHLQQVAKDKPQNAVAPILQLAKVMEYVIYEAKEKAIDVKKEIQFLNNYIQLKNQQLADHSFIEMQVQGEHENLKIAPLLLTGIIDKIMLEGANYYMLLQFYEKELQFLVEVHSNNGHSGLLLDDAIHIRLKELYPQRHEIFQGRSQFTLTIQLDEA